MFWGEQRYNNISYSEKLNMFVCKKLYDGCSNLILLTGSLMLYASMCISNIIAPLIFEGNSNNRLIPINAKRKSWGMICFQLQDAQRLEYQILNFLRLYNGRKSSKGRSSKAKYILNQLEPLPSLTDDIRARGLYGQNQHGKTVAECIYINSFSEDGRHYIQTLLLHVPWATSLPDMKTFTCDVYSTWDKTCLRCAILYDSAVQNGLLRTGFPSA